MWACKMEYVKVAWTHSNADDPIWLYSELDDQRFETRKVEIFANGKIGFADSSEAGGDTELGIEPLPSLEGIASDPQFVPEEITREEFNEVWATRQGRVVGRSELQESLEFPKSVTVRVRPAGHEGLAVSLCFESNRKNHFYYPLFVDRDGFAEVSGEELLRTFDEERSMFIMDYDDPRLVFTGRITAEVQSNADLEGALGAIEIFRGECSFPEGYEEKLRSAAARGQDPDQYRVEVEAKYAVSGSSH
jgi:Domain of unknown function (DUF6881)